MEGSILVEGRSMGTVLWVCETKVLSNPRRTGIEDVSETAHLLAGQRPVPTER